jgi:hypothetical protein
VRKEGEGEVEGEGREEEGRACGSPPPLHTLHRRASGLDAELQKEITVD